MMFKALRTRLTVVCSSITILVLAAVILSALRISETRMQRQAEQAFQSNVASIDYYLRTQQVVDNVWIAQLESQSIAISIYFQQEPYAFNGLKERQSELCGAVYRRDSAELNMLFSSPGTNRLQSISVPGLYERDGREYRTTVLRIPFSSENMMDAVILKDRAQELGEIRELRCIFAGVLLAGALCLFAFSWFFTRWSVRPVEEAQRKQVEFVSAASHELRAPLSVMQLSAEAMAAAEPKQARELAVSIREECARLAKLSQDLLTLAGSDSQRLRMQLSQADPDNLLLATADRFETLAARSEITLSVDLPEELMDPVPCDPDRIAQLLFILVDNAITYTPRGGVVRLAVAQRHSETIFRVADSGPGIPDAEKGRIFDRFYRADKSRTGREHFGLGLSIALEIARMHRGTLSVGDAQPGPGAVFSLALPNRRRTQQK